MKHLNEPLPDIRKAIPDFPRELYDILERMSAKDPNERYINCRELLWDLKSQERRYVTSSATLSRPGQEEAIPTEKVAKIKVDSSLFPGLSKLRNQFPAIFSQDNLLGTMTISTSGSLVDVKGKFPGYQLSPLIQQLIEHVEESKQEQFNDKVQDTIYDFRSKKE